MFETLELILHKNAELRCINLSNLCMEEIAFSKGFKKLKTLRILNLSCKIVGISQTAVTNLSCVIANNVGLEILNLSGNQLGENSNNIWCNAAYSHSSQVHKYQQQSDTP